MYTDAVDCLSELPSEVSVAGKLRRLSSVLALLVAATKGRLKPDDGLSADDLVPLLTLVLVTARVDDLDFEGFVLDEMLNDAVVAGKESYCACTLQVALGFLREVKVDD